MRTRSKLIVIAGIVLALLCILAMLWSSIASYFDEAALKQVAQRIGVTPTYLNVVKYVNNSVQLRMSREEVEALLSQIAPIEIPHRGKLIANGGIEPYVCDELLLKVGPFYGTLRFHACYYGEGRSLFQWVYESS